MNNEENSTREMVAAGLGRPLTEMLTEIGKLGIAEKLPVSLVGGIVRDLLLGRKPVDIDLVIDGDAPTFVERLCAAWPSLFPAAPKPERPIIFKRYRTVKLPFAAEIAPQLSMLELASTRTESYPIPGGRPEILPADLRADLARRDFSINAMAISIAEGDFALLDLFHGVADLKRGLLNTLHGNSFLDDPARLLRGLRFAARFQFQFGEETKRQFNEAVGGRFIETLPRARLLDEFRKLLLEHDPGSVLELLSEHRLLGQIHPEFRYQPAVAQQLTASPSWQKRFRLLFPQLNTNEFESVLKFFMVNDKEKQAFQLL